jgi:phage tail sheath protein FI
MPDYLAPGVYVEETNYRDSSLTGVSTSTAAFVGPTAYGPTSGTPQLITCLADFTRIYGGFDQLTFSGPTATMPNYMALAVRAFFQEGGSLAYVSRLYAPATSKVQSHVATAILRNAAGTLTVAAAAPGPEANGTNVTFNFKLQPPSAEPPAAGTVMVSDVQDGPEGASAHGIYVMGANGQLYDKDGTAKGTFADLSSSHQLRTLVISGMTAQTPGSVESSFVTAQMTLNPDAADFARTTPDQPVVVSYVPANNQTMGHAANVAELLLHVPGLGSSLLDSLGRLQPNTDVPATVTLTAGTMASGGSGQTGTASYSGASSSWSVTARWPGAYGNASVQCTLRTGPNCLVSGTVKGVSDYDVLVPTGSTNASDAPSYLVRMQPDSSGRLQPVLYQGTTAVTIPTSGTLLQLVMDVVVTMPDAAGTTYTYSGLTWDPADPRSLSQTFFDNPQDPTIPIIVELPAGVAGDAVANAVLKLAPTKGSTLQQLLGKTLSTVSAPAPAILLPLKGGSDGVVPVSGDYDGSSSPDEKVGLVALEDVEDVAIVAAPGSTASYDSAKPANVVAITEALIAHCEKMKYRVAVLDSPPGLSVQNMLAYRQNFDSEYAAMYYPWVQVMDPTSNRVVNTPPSGFVAGIYARSDGQYGVEKAPANEVVRTAVGFEFTINKGQQEVLNPAGVNCFRVFPQTGKRLWGARSISSDVLWRYINVRRYFCYLEHSIDNGMQWAVFMDNGQQLWDNVRRTVESFLMTEWKNGRLMGGKPTDAYFVNCGFPATMTQNDLDNGRLVCEVGVSPVRPAEFVIFRVGQWLASAN